MCSPKLFVTQTRFCIFWFKISQEHPSYFRVDMINIVKRHLIGLPFRTLGSSTQASFLRKGGLTFKLRYYFASKTINLPNVADSVSEGKVLEFKKNVGDWADIDETVALLETDKVTVDIKAPVAGAITKFHVKEGDNLEVGKPFFDIDSEAAGKKSDKSEKKAEKKEEPKPDQSKKQQSRASSQQHKQTQSKQQQQPQSQSRPQQQQPKQQLKKSNEQTKAAGKPQPQQQPVFRFSTSASQRKQMKEPISSLRVKSGERLKQIQNIYALLTTFQQCDVGNALDIIQRNQEQFIKKFGTNLSLLAFFIKASAGAIIQNPIVNCYIDGIQLVRRNYVDINVSLATPLGIISPLIRNCNVKSIFNIQQELAELTKSVNDGKLALEQLENGTFSINNAQVDVSLMSTPILRPLQSGMLGMNSIETKPVARNGQIVARPIMYISMTYDHRILDGKDAVVTLKSVKDQIEDPSKILLGL